MNIIKKGTDSIITTIALVIAFIWLIPLIWMISENGIYTEKYNICMECGSF